MQIGTMMHLGEAASAPTPAPAPTTVLTGFTDGLSLWKSPGTAIKAITSVGTMYTVNGMTYTIGYLAVPLALAAAVAMAMSQSRRGR